MNAEILAVGTELLIGQIANTNAQYISQRLNELGINVYYHSVVGDNPGRLKQSLNIAFERANIIIMTGGLGPTKDDLTKEIVSETLNKELVLDEYSLNKIKAYFEKIKRSMVEKNEKQAYFPKDCIILENNNGTAPGCIIENDKNVIILLPGPPKEMKLMFEEAVIPYFRKKSDFKIVSTYLRVFGIGESALENKIMDIINGQSNPTIAPYAGDFEVTLRVTARCKDDEDPNIIIDPIVNKIKSRIGNAIYSTDNKPLKQVVGELLIRSNITISVAESCTGGLIASELTSVPGISKVFNRGVVSYSNESKIEFLNVNPSTLQKFGAVSQETAIEMANGIRRLSNTNLGVGVTGIAGPEGGTKEKPVGLVYIALAHANDTICKELKLWGDRSEIRYASLLNTLDLIRNFIIDQ